MSSRNIGGVLACGLFLAGLAGSVRADGPVTWVSAEAMAYVELSRPEDLIDRATEPTLVELYQGIPGLEDRLRSSEIRQARAFAGLMAGSLGTTPEKALRRLTSGGLVVALEPGEGEGPPRLLAVLTPGDADFLNQAHDRVLALLGTQSKDTTVRRGEHRGIATYQFSEQEAHAIVEGRLVVASGLSLLHEAIDRALGESDTPRLAEAPAFRAAREAVGDDRLAFAFARLGALRALNSDTSDSEPDAGAKFLLGAWIEALVRSEWAGAGIDWRDRRIAASLIVPGPEGGFSEAMARFRPSAGQGSAPLLEPPGTILSASLWRDFESIWEVRQEIFPPEQLANLAQLDSTAGTFFGGRDFGTGVLGSIAREWRVVIAHQDYDALQPQPDQKLPGLALVVGLKPDDEEFQIRLMSAFQSLVGLVNLGSAQQQSPPLMLGSEEHRGATLATSRYLALRGASEDGGPIDSRYNLSPTAGVVDDTFILSTSADLARNLVDCLRDAPEVSPGPGPTLRLRADGSAVARLVELNRGQLAMRNMLQKGSTRASAEDEIDLLARLARYLGEGRLSIEDREDSVRLDLEFQLRP